MPVLAVAVWLWPPRPRLREPVARRRRARRAAPPTLLPTLRLHLRLRVLLLLQLPHYRQEKCHMGRLRSAGVQVATLMRLPAADPVPAPSVPL